MTGPRHTAPKFTGLVTALPATVPFVGPEELQRKRGAPFRARLGANENVFGPSPRAVEAMRQEAAEIWKYADASHDDLKEALAADAGVAPDNIVIGEGIDGLLGYAVRLMVEPGVAVVTSDGAYPTFNYHVAGYGGALHKVPYSDDHEDLPALIARAGEVSARIVYLANPDNPMGTCLPGAEIAAALDTLPEGCTLFLDEAYIEFAPEGTAPDIAPDDPRVIRFRTFSKGYGMAGARVGYALGQPEVIRSFDKIRNHFGMNRMAVAGALAAIRDPDWLRSVQGWVRDSKQEITAIAQENGLSVVPSATNFVAVDCGADGVFARRVLAALAEDGVFVRMPFVAPQDRCIRISAGRAEDMAILRDALPKALEKARQG
ncbi:pyridoxal phosphate-dependent aminotransferase [Sagittula salina]|uniref:Pyridoxal phosphate-dependent aminotransferase n=1 Tax=Sagittula salina TaxID=2820268 RepID=A0A940MKW7_9RHOB|nr:pyridoxal phosphate-dependent aminotransferase [Sagittula salina]MBP0483386.1 pyridoxal phosphate-dependent aminotransferase [Sagittula salina]